MDRFGPTLGGSRAVATAPITRHSFGGPSAMAHASYVISARDMALDAPPLAWFCAAPWPPFSPP